MEQPTEYQSQNPSRPAEPAQAGTSDLEAFTGLLKTGAATPAATFVGVALAFALGIQLAAGLVVGLASTNSSFVDLGEDSSVLSEMFLQTAAFTQASLQSSAFGGFELSTAPLLFSLFPAGAIWLAFRLFGDRLGGDEPRVGIIASAALCLLFALGVTIFAAIGGDLESDGLTAGFSEGDVFLLALLWALAGAAVAYVARFGPPPMPSAVPSQVRGGLRLASMALRPLAILLAVCAVVGLAAWEVQVVRDVGKDDSSSLSVRGERSLPGAIFETVLYAPDIGVHFASVGGMAAFHNRLYPSGLAFPVTKVDELTGVGEDDFSGLDREDAAVSAIFETPGTYRIWDYSDPLPGWAFVGLLALTPLVLLFWAYAGFVTARHGKPETPVAAATLGALIGPVLGLIMVVLNALTQNFVYGDGDGGSVFLMFTFGAAVVGAAGGLLATRVNRPAGPAPAD